MPVAAILIATLGVISYFFLVRHIMKGPMLAQILGTFGLALFLRYGALWFFGANFKSLPDNIVGHSFVRGGIRFEGSRVLAAAVGLGVTLLLHLILTRTAIGSRMLAVSEEGGGGGGCDGLAQLMRHPAAAACRRAKAWSDLAGAATGIAGALIALFLPISPTSGETLAIAGALIT